MLPRDGDYLPTYADLSNAVELLERRSPYNAELQKKVQELAGLGFHQSYCVKCIEKTNNRDLTNQDENLTFPSCSDLFFNRPTLYSG